MNKLEKIFVRDFVEALRKRVPESLVFYLDPARVQGAPDLIVFAPGGCYILEAKRSEKAAHRPNQDYYVNKLSEWGAYARFLTPQNMEKVIDDIHNESCLSKSI